jgi:hypothetical protein
MKIETGRYYRMRCGGAVRIVLKTELYCDSEGGNRWLDEGKWSISWGSPFDLIAEITEVANGLLRAENERLEKAVSFYQKEREEWKGKYCELYDHDLKNRRERIATAVFAEGYRSVSVPTEKWAKECLNAADALIKALEVQS